MLIDTYGNLLAAVVNAADEHDQAGASALFERFAQHFPRSRMIWADSKYGGSFAEWLQRKFNIDVEVVKRAPEQTGFVVLPKRWLVERSIAWVPRYRRLGNDYEGLTITSEGLLYLASIRHLLRRITLKLVTCFKVTSPSSSVPSCYLEIFKQPLSLALPLILLTSNQLDTLVV